MKDAIFKYDTRLTPHELAQFQDLIGTSISGLRLENASLVPPPYFHISNTGLCTINFFHKVKRHSVTLELRSIFQETPPVVDSGGFAFTKIFHSSIPTRTRMNLGMIPMAGPSTSITYPEHSPIAAIKFYGSFERRSIREIFPDVDLDYIKLMGYSEFPKIEVDTIEFIIIEHENGKKTIVRSESGGFGYNFLTDQPISDTLIYDSYMKVNGYEKNIVLQHEVSSLTQL